MPGLTVKVPALHKQKSKLRLRLGLGAPEPTTTYTTITTSTASPKLAPITNSIGEARTRALDTSTSTSTTTNTRADTWSAFDLDISPSIDSASQYHPGYGAAGSFDTVSYRSVSPDSLATEAAQLAKVYAHNERTAQPESPRRDHNPTPSLSPENTLPRPRHLPDIRRKRLIEPDEESLRLPWTEKEFDNLAAGTEDTFSLTDAQLNSRFNFVKEVGFGNWGSVWYCRLRRMTAASFLRSQTQGGGDSGAFAVFRLGKIAQAGGEGGAGGAVAAKLINRVNDEVSAVRVQSLWNEMKVIRALRHEPHPSIIQFESFIITPSYALIIMPFHSRMIPVNIDPDYARPYFRQLASAVGYLHERGITHNDIKPANILLSHSNVPVLVDFGFAQRWNVDSERTFLSNICWGTPEYLDPQRFKGLPHDERASDVWALGVTMFEILVGRTPFESTRVLPNQDGDGLSSDSTDSVDEKSPIPTEEEYKEYHERTKTGLWYGKYNIPSDLEHLLRLMMSPDPEYRINAMQVYHHRALLLPEPQPVVTPQFVRAAATFEEATEHPVPAQKQKRVKKVKSRPATREGRASTPALGESIKQHTNTVEPSPSRAKGHSGESDGTPKKKAMVIRKSQDDLLQPIHAKHNDDTTPTKVLKPAQPLRVRDVPAKNIKRVMPRASASQISDLVGSSATSKGDRIHSKADHRVSAVSAVSSSGAPARDKEHAVLRTMRSLEGTRRIPDKPKKDVRDSKDRDVLGAIKRPAPSPPRPQSLDSSLQQDKKTNKAEQRRSLGADKHLAEVTEESPIKAVPAPVVDAQPKESTPKKQKSPAGKIHQRQPSIPSPPRVRMATRPTAVAAGITDRQLCSGPVESPMAELRERIMNMDKNQATELRQTATDLVSSSTDHALQLDAYIHSVDTEQLSSLTVAVTATETAGPSSQEPDAAMEKFKLWVQGVEKIVEDARKALAEGREPPMPPLSYPDFVKQPEQASSKTTAEKPQLEVTEHMPESSGSRGLSPEKSASLPVHLRTCSTQVEPATPPKWMTYEQAEERDKAAGEQEYLDRPQSGSVDAVVVRNVPKKERPTVSHVLKLFGNEKGPSRTVSPEPVATVPLKSAHHGPTLRGAPSTPALRSATTVRQSSKPLARKSESNLRNFNTMPSHLSLVQGVAPTSSPRRLVYEDLLDSTPGVVRQGDGWSSNMYSGRGMSKPTSMASLRERAMAFLGNDHARENRDSVDLSVGKTHPVATRTGVRDRHIIDLASEVEKDKSGRNSRNDTLPVSGRPGTPSALSTLNAKGAPFDGKKQGLFGKLKGLVGRRGMDKVEEQ